MKPSVFELMTGKKKETDEKQQKEDNSEKQKPAESNSAAFKYISTTNGNNLKEELIPDKEWKEKFMMWFQYMRIYINVLGKSHEENNIDNLLKSIENGEPPVLSSVAGCDDICDLFGLFANYEIPYNKNDLMWIFTIAIYETRLAPDDSVASMQKILDKIVKQLNNLESKNDPLYSELMIPYMIITSFFHSNT